MNSMQMVRRSVMWCVLAACMFLVSCRNGVLDPQQPASEPTISTTIAGVVLDEVGVPLVGATVSVGSASTTTNVMGMYMLSNVTVPQQRACVVVRRSGYFTAARAAWPQSSGTTMVNVRMMRWASTTTFSATKGGGIRAGAASVELAPMSLVTASGELYDGTVTAAVRFLDPDTTAGFAQYFSGDASARRSNGTATQLLSHGVLRVVLTDDRGQPLQIKDGSTALVSYPVSKGLAALGASSIPLWYFDETTGYWKEEGEASLIGGRYTGYVRHFTDWNLDSPKPRATIQGTVRCASGRPLAHVVVTIGQVSAMTNDSGQYQHHVPANTAFNVQVQAAFNDGTASAVVAVADLAESEVRTVDLVVSPCSSILEGTLVDCADQPTAGFLMITSAKGTKYVATSTGAFRVDVPSGVPLTVTAMATSGQSAPDVNVPAIPSTELVALGNVRACGGTQFDYVDLDLGAISPISAAYIDNGQSVAVLTTSKVYIYAATDGKLQRTIDLAGSTTPFESVSNFMFSTDGRLMLVQGGKSLAKLYDVASEMEKTTLRGVGGAYLLPSGENVVAFDSAGNVRLYSVVDGTPLRQYNTISGRETAVIGSIPGGSDMLFVNYHFTNFSLFNLTTESKTTAIDSIRRVLQTPILSPDGSTLSVVAEGRMLKSWSTFYSIPSFKQISSVPFAADSEQFSVLAIAPSNQAYLSVRRTYPYQTDPVMIRDVNGTAQPRMLLVPVRCTDVKWAAYAPDGGHAAALFRINGQFATIRIWKL